MSDSCIGLLFALVRVKLRIIRKGDSADAADVFQYIDDFIDQNQGKTDGQPKIDVVIVQF